MNYYISISCAIIERERKREEKTVEYCARGEITIFKTSRCEEKEKEKVDLSMCTELIQFPFLVIKFIDETISVS